MIYHNPFQTYNYVSVIDIKFETIVKLLLPNRGDWQSYHKNQVNKQKRSWYLKPYMAQQQEVIGLIVVV